jgi:hypothetical protein
MNGIVHLSLRNYLILTIIIVTDYARLKFQQQQKKIKKIGYQIKT